MNYSTQKSDPKLIENETQTDFFLSSQVCSKVDKNQKESIADSQKVCDLRTKL
jgi:hypothetical protein